MITGIKKCTDQFVFIGDIRYFSEFVTAAPAWMIISDGQLTKILYQYF